MMMMTTTHIVFGYCLRICIVDFLRASSLSYIIRNSDESLYTNTINQIFHYLTNQNMSLYELVTYILTYILNVRMPAIADRL